MKNKALTSLTGLLLATAASVPLHVAAAEPVADAIIANEGIGFSRMEDGKVIAYDTVAAYEENQIVVANCDAYKAEYKNVSWCFASREHADMFKTAIGEGQTNYIPFGGGHCALGLSFGNMTAKGDPRTAVRIGNALVLNGNFNVRAQFLTDTERNMDNGRLRYQIGLENATLAPN